MPKLRFKEMKSLLDRSKYMDTENLYNNKYFALWLNSRHFPELTKDQERYLMKSLWAIGSTCAFVIEGSKPIPDMTAMLSNADSNTLILENKNPNGVLCLVPYAPCQWNINDEPSVVTYVPKRGAKFIPEGQHIVNDECVIIWAHPSHKPVYSLVSWYIERITDIERTIKVNLFAHKMPRLVVHDIADEQRVQEIVAAIEEGQTKIFLSTSDWQAIKNVLDGGATYIIDKLHQYKQNVENELLTMLGINNTPHEKAERLITDEANSNNQLINQYGDCFKDTIDSSCEDVREVLGFPLTQKVKEYEVEAEPKEPEEGEEND